MSEQKKKPKVFGLPVKVDPYLSIRVQEPKGRERAVPVRPAPVRQERSPEDESSLVVDFYPGRKP